MKQNKALEEKYAGKLWCDLKTDRDRYEFIISGRAVDTGIIAPSIVRDVAKAFMGKLKQ